MIDNHQRKIHQCLSSLAILYHRHGANDRALLYGIAAAKCGDWSPSLALVVGSLFLRHNEPGQAEAVLSRFFHDQVLLTTSPDLHQMANAAKLMARAKLRLGDKEDARHYAEQATLYTASKMAAE